MRFADPSALWALLAVPILGALLAYSILRRARALARIAEPALLSRIVASVGGESRIVKAGLICAAAAFLALGLARPQWGTKLDPVARRGVDVVIAVDVSSSMLSEDLKPSRLAKAQSAAGRLLNLLGGDRVAVAAFAGSAATLCPLTLDHAAAKLFVDALDTSVLSDAGTSLATGMRQIASTFRSPARRFKAAVIFSDGEDHGTDVEDAIREAADQGIVIHTVGVGTVAGGPIPLRDEKGAITGYKADRQGRVVTSRLVEELLSAIAERTGGVYQPATPGEGEVERIAEAIGGMDKREMQQRLLTQYEDRFQVPLGIALLVLIVEALIPDRKKGKAGSAWLRKAAALALVGGCCGAIAMAASAPSLVEEGNRLFKEGKYDEALKAYTQAQIAAPDSPEIQLNIGNVFYRKGEFEKAREAYARAFAARQRALQESARFNAGTAHLSANNLKEAVEEYREALKIDPEDSDARRNLELALKRLEQLKPPPTSSSTQKDQKEGPSPRQDQQKEGQDPNRPPSQASGGAGEEKPGEEKEPKGREGRADRKERQEAERILDALRAEDKPKLNMKDQRRPERPPEKDW